MVTITPFTNQLLEWDVKRNDDTNELLLNSDLYRIHMDNRVDIPNADLTYDPINDVTTFNMPQVNAEDAIVRFNRDVFGYCVIAGAPQQGVLQQVTWNANVGSLPGDWISNLPNYNIQIGYTFDYKVVLPQFYRLSSQEPVRYDSRASLLSIDIESVQAEQVCSPLLSQCLVRMTILRCLKQIL